MNTAKFQKLKTLANKAISLRLEAEKQIDEMTNHQKENWELTVICFLRQAETNLNAIVEKARKKMKTKNL